MRVLFYSLSVFCLAAKLNIIKGKGFFLMIDWFVHSSILTQCDTKMR